MTEAAAVKVDTAKVDAAFEAVVAAFALRGVAVARLASSTSNVLAIELNGTHPLVEKLGQRAQSNADDEVIAEYIEVLYDQAKLAEGGVPDDPGLYGRRVAKLLSLGV